MNCERSIGVNTPLEEAGGGERAADDDEGPGARELGLPRFTRLGVASLESTAAAAPAAAEAYEGKAAD